MRQLKIARSVLQAIGVCISTILVCLECFAQAPTQELALKDQFTEYSRQALQEKIYLHTDKDFYLAGEICWFKIYNTDASFNMPLGISKLVYVEVFDKNNKPVLQAKVTLNGGSGNGSLQWPISLSSGKYLLRAYTNWMKNFDAAYFFEKTLTVINTRKIYTDTVIAKKDSYSARFYPEGGNLVNSLQSTVAFKITDQYGRGVACTGAVVDEHNDTVVSFATAKFGMGHFLFTPGQPHSYKAIINIAGNRVEQTLPAAYPGGYVMHLSKENNGQLKIRIRSAALNESSSLVYLFVHTRGVAKLVNASEMHAGECIFLVDTGKLGEGISQFTVFNAARQPVCERLFFKKPAQPLEIAASTDREVYEPRSKVTMRISSSNGTGKPIMANMSVAVLRVDTLTPKAEIDINNYLWLRSDLTGDIESPGYYFSAPAEPAAEAADNLMMTQGWRRFRWEDILQNKKPAFQFVPEYKGHIVKGKVTATTGVPVKAIESFLAVPGTKTQFRDAFSDDTGAVKFEMSNFYGNDEIILQTTGQEDGSKHIEIASPFVEKPPVSVLPPFALPNAQAVSLAGLHLNVQVQNAYLFNKLKQMVLPAAVDTTAFYSKPDKAYWLDDYVRFTTVEEILREYVPDVNVRRRNGKFQLPVFDNIRKEFFRVSPLILLDGVPVLDADKIMSYDPLKIKKLEVLARMYFYGNMFFGGIINFITYQGDIPGFELDPHATVIDYGTLQMQREFFSPSYETPQLAASRLPDFRTLLYWSPSVQTGISGKNEMLFYTSDLPGRFAAIIEGITGDGKTGTQTVFFTVKEKDGLAGSR